GYDSAGVAIVNGRQIETRKCAGRIANLAKLMTEKPPSGQYGISHTRWATHGKVTDENAHPHFDQSGKIALVHNGVIENYAALREQLEREGGHRFTSDTDTEVLAHLIGSIYERIDGADSKARLVNATRAALKQVIGTYGIALVHSDIKDFMIGARRGSPLVLGVGKDENFLASDVSAIVAHTRDAVYLNDFDIVALTMTAGELRDVSRVVLTGCRTALHAALVGEYLIEQLANIPVEVEYASEFRHRNTPMSGNTLVFTISQSGETADTLGALRESQRKGFRTLGICNNVASTIARESDGGVYMHAGPEIGVAATKSFTSQVTILALIGLLLGRMRHLSTSQGSRVIEALEDLPDQIESALKLSDQIRSIAKKY